MKIRTPLDARLAAEVLGVKSGGDHPLRSEKPWVGVDQTRNPSDGLLSLTTGMCTGPEGAAIH